MGRGVIVFVGIVCGCGIGDMRGVLEVKRSVMLIPSHSSLILIVWIHNYKLMTNAVPFPVQTRNDPIHFYLSYPRCNANLHSDLTQIHTNSLTIPIPLPFSFQRI